MSVHGRRVTVQVPATSANLGPGFDTLGLALAYTDTLTVETTASGVTVDVTGEGAHSVPRDHRNLVAATVAEVFQRAGVPVPGLRLTAHNRIPHGRGMGSSAAAIVSGVVAAAGLLADRAEFSTQDLLMLATEIEGHPDNVAPALLGGLTIAWMTGAEAGSAAPAVPRAKQLAVHRGVAPLVLVPEFQMSTRLARSLQPEQVPHEDAVFNVSRSALLIAALTQSPELLFEATEDRLHQSYRSTAMPETHALISQLRERGYAAVVSGAGPSVLVLAHGPEQRLAAMDFVAEHAPEWRRHALAVHTEGATIEHG